MAGAGRCTGAQIAVALLLSFLAISFISISPSAADDYETIQSIDPGATGALYIAYEVLLSFPGGTKAVEIAALTCLFAAPLRIALLFMPNARKPSVVVPAIFFALCMVWGQSYDLKNSPQLVVGGISNIIEAVLAGAGWALIAWVGIAFLYRAFDWLRLHRSSADASAVESASVRVKMSLRIRAACTVRGAFEQHSFLAPFVVLSIAWAPMLAGSMPGIFMGDTHDCIFQWFNLPSGTSGYLNLVNPDVMLNAHHPVAYTALLGTCAQIGIDFLGSENRGIALYSFLQFFLTAGATAYCLSVLHRLGASFAVRASSLAFFALVPIFPNYALLATKDTIFADALVVLVAQLALFVGLGVLKAKDDSFANISINKRDVALLLLACLGCAFFRNGGIVCSLVACVLMALVSWRAHFTRRLAMSLGAIGATLALWAGFAYVLCPALDITPASEREALSVPFQQTALFVKVHDGANSGIEGGASDGLVSKEEREVIDVVLDYDDLAARYNPNLSDSVKAKYNENATSDELAAYFEAWAEMFVKDPATYLSASANNYYGYFYPSKKTGAFYTFAWSDECMAKANERSAEYLDECFDFHPVNNPVVKACKHVSRLYQRAFQQVPVLSLLVDSATYVWFLLLVAIYLLRERKWRAASVLAPLFVVLAVLLIGPCNGATYSRYVYPIMMCAPLVLCAVECSSARFRSFRCGCSVEGPAFRP